MFLTINTKIFIPSNDVKNAIVPEKIKVIGEISKLSPIIVLNNKYTEEDNIAKEPINIEETELESKTHVVEEPTSIESTEPMFGFGMFRYFLK